MLRKLFIALVLTTAASSTQAENLSRAELLLRDGDAAGALTQLSGYQPASQAATQRYLWARAIANMRLRQPSAALPYLERLVAMFPRDPRFRLELAVALGQLDQSERALYHIEIVRSAGLPQALDARAAAYASRLENPKVVSGYFSFAIVPESNAAKRTSATEVTLFGLPFQINPNSRAEPATGLEFSFGAAVTPQIAPGWRAQIGFSARTRFYDGKAPDDYFGRLHAGIIHGFVETGQTNAQVFTMRRSLDKRHYSRSVGVSLRHARRLSPSTRLNVQAGREHQTLRNGTKIRRSTGSVNVTHIFNPQLEMSLGAQIERRGSSLPSLAGQLSGIRAGAQYRFTGGLQVAMDLEYDRNRFDGPHPLFLIERRDRRSKAQIQLSHSQWNWRGFAPVLRLQVERQKSNIIVNNFKNIGASIGATRRF